MYRQRLTNLFVSLLLLGLVIVGCTPAAGNETAVGPVDNSARTEAPESLTPQQVTLNFYNWYLEIIGDRSDGSFTNPLVEGLYHDSEYLTADFVARIDETRAGFENGGFDPILLAQDIPVSFEVQEPAINGAEAAAVVLRYWGGNPDPDPMVVHLMQVDGRWLIDNVTPFEIPVMNPPVEPETPETVAQAFYDWYLAYIGDPATDDFRNPLVDKAYHDAPYLTASFVGHIDELLAEMREQGAGGYDPILCAQAIPTEMTPDVVFSHNGLASVVMRSNFPNHLVTVDLRPEGESWVIGNITCAMDPAGVATAFYTWYLGYIGDRASGDFRNPLVDQAYQDHPLLAECLTQEVDDLLAEMREQGTGGYDPFLLAQDIPADFSVDPGVAEGTAVVHLQFGADSVRHLRVTLNEQRKISAIAEDPGLPNEAPTGEVDAGSSTAQAIYLDNEYGFSFSYPTGWVMGALDMQGPGMPDDWPVLAAWLLMPQDVADTLAAQSGPPDPNAPVIVAPFNVEVVMGDEQAMARVYPDFAIGETARINGHDAIILRQEPGYSHVIFAHPLRPNTWIVFTDWVTGFPGREAQVEVAAPAWQPLLESLQFHS